MDDLQLLREMRDDIGSVPPATLTRGRKKVMAKVSPNSASTTTDTHTKGTVSPIRFRRRALIVSAAAALLVGGIVGAEVIRPTPGATAEAAEALHNAAAATSQTSDPVVKPGQYLKIDTTAVYSMGVLLGEKEGERRTVSWLDKSSDHLYVPADRTDEWIWDREARIPTTFFSEEAEAVAAKYQAAQVDAGDTIRTGELLRAPAGNFYGEPSSLFADTPLLEGIKSLPRDPQALLDTIRERSNPGRSGRQTLESIAAALKTGPVPADLRAALYKAAALIPGVTVVDRQTNLDGEVGIAIGIEDPDKRTRMDIIIEPATGLFIGERVVTLTDGETFPAGTATGWTSVRTSVVASAP
ncbi:hypothetical protein GCM10027403_22790 [Arthrobacter tecti]